MEEFGGAAGARMGAAMAAGTTIWRSSGTAPGGHSDAAGIPERLSCVA